MEQFLAVLTYSSTIGMLLLATLVYRGGMEGFWPPRSRTIYVVGWAWYLSTSIAALWLSFLGPPIHISLGDVSWKIAGWSLITMGGILGAWAFATFRSAERVLGWRIDKLITWGPYHYTRNPQYVSFMLLLFGITLIQNSMYFLPFAVMAALASHLWTLLEERGLEKIFGEEYKKYRREVPRYLPRLKSSR